MRQGRRRTASRLPVGSHLLFRKAPTVAVTVRLPRMLARHADGHTEVCLEASSIRELVQVLGAAYPAITPRLCDETGRLRNALNLFVNNRNVRSLAGTDTPLQDGDEISIMPLMAGG